MAQTYKVLGQSDPTAATPADLYTVPSATSTVVSSIVVANRSGSEQSFRVSIRVGGAGAEAKQYLAYDIPVPANDTIYMQLGITMAATDVLTVYASAQQLSFNAFGVETT